MPKSVTPAKQAKALDVIATYLGPKMGHITPCGQCESCVAGLAYDWQCDNPAPKPAPTGRDAAYNGEGPMLSPEWDWPSSGPTPTILLEGGPGDWAIMAAGDPEVIEQMTALGIFAEPYASYALCLYPA